jgi:hypothetical protein
METLELLKDYASTTDNVFLFKKLELLEIETELAITRAKIQVINETNKDNEKV